MNQVLVKKGTNKTLYKLWYGQSPSVKYLKKIVSKFYIKRDDSPSKFKPESDEGILLGYSTKNRAYGCLNKRTKKMVESVNKIIDEFPQRFENETRRLEIEGNLAIEFIELEEPRLVEKN